MQFLDRVFDLFGLCLDVGQRAVLGDLALGRIIFGAERRSFGSRLRQSLSGELVEHLDVIFFTEQARRLVLTVDVRERMRDRSEHAESDARAVDAADVLAVDGHRACEQYLTAVKLYAALFEKRRGGGILTCLEKRGDGSGIAPVADERLVRPLAQHKFEAVDDDGLARARLAGEDVEPVSELRLEIVDERYVFDVE